MHRRRPILVSRARHPLARLGPVWAVLTISLLAAFMPTSPAAAEIEDQPGKLTPVAGQGPEGQDNCLADNRTALRESGALVFPGPGSTDDVRFNSSVFQPAGLAFDPVRNQLFVASAPVGTIGLGANSRVSPLNPGPAGPSQSDTGVDIAVDASGNAFFGGRGNARVMMAPAGGGVPVHLAGADGPGDAWQEGRAALRTKLAGPTSLAVTGQRVFVADGGFVRVIERGQQDAPIFTLAGGGTADPASGGLATSAQLSPTGAAGLAVKGNLLYIVETSPPRVLQVDLGSDQPRISQIVGAGQLKAPRDVVVDSGNNLYISDQNKVVMRRPSGALEPVAGTGGERYSAADDWAQGATLNRPSGLAMDAQDNLYIADSNHCVIRRVQQPALVKGTSPTTRPTTPAPAPVNSPPSNDATLTPPGNTAGDPTAVGSGDPGGAGGGDPVMSDTTGGFDTSGVFDNSAFGSDFFRQFSGFFNQGGVSSGVPGGGFDLGGGGGALTSPLPTPGPLPVQPAPPPVASAPPLVGQGLSGNQVGLVSTGGQLPRGGARYTMVRADQDTPAAAMALATGAAMLFSCVLVLAAGPASARGSTTTRRRGPGSRTRPWPGIAY